MSITFQVIATLVTLVPLTVVLGVWITHARPRLRHTTLRGAGTWLIVAISLWILTVLSQSILRIRGTEMFPGLSSRLNYLALTLWLTPSVSVLGAKRPGVRFWNLFVVVPMLLMLNWPAFSAERDILLNHRLDMEAPALMGFFVVLLMVLGNYFGTIFTFPALLYCGALAGGLCSFSDSLPSLMSAEMLQRGLVSLLLAGSLFWSKWIMKWETQHRHGYLRVWLDFRDWFGILWTRRVMDRLNQTAQTEQWRARLTLERIEWEDGLSDEQRLITKQKMDRAFRWMFRRFVDESWIDERLSDQ